VESGGCRVATYGELRRLLDEQALGWQTRQDADQDTVPEWGLGASPEGLPHADETAALDLRELLDAGPNPYLAVRRFERGIVTGEEVRQVVPERTLRRLGFHDVLEAREAGEPPEAGAAKAVDWRNRWGQNWITSVRDQNPCNSCWAFTSVALVEAMMRIEHAMWTRLSEGDVHRGTGATCADYGTLKKVSDFFAANGFCDPGAFPWTTNDPLYRPTPDRNGRSVRGLAFEWPGSVQDCKNWIDTVGPVIAWLEIWSDFDGYTSGVYRKSTAPTNALRGTHFVLVVGYDDAQQAWLIKNSWGAGWGMGGYGWVGYGEANIDLYAKAAVRNVNPDPWTKRRLHNGNLYESGNGALHRNFEVAGAAGSRVLHRWREGGPPWAWSAASSFAADAAVCPTLIGTTYNRNLELVYRTTGGRLHHWWTGGGGRGPWNDGGVFGPADCVGVPGLIQADYGTPGNFEVVVLVGGGQLQLVWREGGTWHDGPRFGSGLAYSGPTLVQTTYGAPHGELQCVAVRADGAMQHFWRDEAAFSWNAGALFGAGIASSPVMIQSQYGMLDERGPHGNFELCVAAGGQVQHWWRANSTDGQWRRGATFGHDVLSVAGLCQSSWGMNLEVIVVRTDQHLQHYWRDRAGWHEGPVIGRA
jgi:hypothetical protein